MRSEFCSTATVQSNRRHMAWCLQHHWSQPQGSLTYQVNQCLFFLFSSPSTRQDIQVNHPFTDYFIPIQMRRMQTGSCHHCNNEDMACAALAEGSINGLMEPTNFKWF